MSALRKGARITAAGVTVTDVQSVKAERRKPTRTGLPRSSAASNRLSTIRARSRPTRRDLSLSEMARSETRLPSEGVKRGCASRSNAPACVIPGSLSSVMICRSRTSEMLVVRKCFIGCPAESTLRPSPTKVAPGLRRLITRPETDHPCSRTRSTGEVG